MPAEQVVSLFIPHMIEIINGKYAAITKTIPVSYTHLTFQKTIEKAVKDIDDIIAAKDKEILEV